MNATIFLLIQSWCIGWIGWVSLVWIL